MEDRRNADGSKRVVDVFHLHQSSLSDPFHTLLSISIRPEEAIASVLNLHSAWPANAKDLRVETSFYTEV